jgi:ACS family tartrate transporter-like MFS transporter
MIFKMNKKQNNSNKSDQLSPAGEETDLQSGSGNENEVKLTQEQSRILFSKITWRLIPLLFLCYIIAYIDRINVGFAKLQLREVLGVDEAVFGSIYGLGAGLFFVGYFLFEVPSNLILQRVGARIWIARIMIIWGFVAVAMMFISSTTAFYFMRFLLGVAEAGFYPGVILYLTYWYPAQERAKTIALFATGGVIAGIVGSPLSGAILGINGIGGLEGWQWLFLLEGFPAVLLGLVVLFVLPNGPHKAKWLSAEEKIWIKMRIDEENSLYKGKTSFKLSEALTSSRVWLLCLIYFLLNVGGYGYEMWMPSIIKGFSGMSYTIVGLINAIPYIAAAVAMLLVGQHSDRTGERRWHVAIAAITSAAGFAFSAYLQNPYLAMLALTVAFVGLKSTVGPFWALGTAYLSGTAAAGGIAFINSVGNLGGFVGPTLVGVIIDRTGNNAVALWILGGALLLMGMSVLMLRDNPKKNK